MATPVDWDARPRAWLTYLKHLKDTNETAHRELMTKIDARDLANVKWAASAQRTGDQQQADDAESVIFSDTEEELQWKDPAGFFRSWTHAKAREHRAKIRNQRGEIEARRKDASAGDNNTPRHELPADGAAASGHTMPTNDAHAMPTNDANQTTTNFAERSVPPLPTTQSPLTPPQSGPRPARFSSHVADKIAGALDVPPAPPGTHTRPVTETSGRGLFHDQQGGRAHHHDGGQAGLHDGGRPSPGTTRRTAPAGGLAADVQAIKDIGRRRYTEQLKREEAEEEAEEEEMRERLARLRTS